MWKIAKPGVPFDPVNRPHHYASLNPEPLDVIEAWGLDYHLGNVLKYIARNGLKGDPIQDLKKARVYLSRKILLLEREGAKGLDATQKVVENESH